MPKPHTFPTLYNEALQISVSKLKELEYFKTKQIKSGTLTWSMNGNPIGSISIKVDIQTKHPYIELDYKFRDEPRNYKLKLVSISSNLGKGIIWYFLCPQTNKRCRKLYLIGGYFLHREAFNGCMYQSQTQSKSYRQIDKTLGGYFRTDDLYGQLYQKHFKKTYAGKPTKRYLKLMQKINKAESIPYYEIEQAMMNKL